MCALPEFYVEALTPTCQYLVMEPPGKWLRVDDAVKAGPWPDRMSVLRSRALSLFTHTRRKEAVWGHHCDSGCLQVQTRGLRVKPQNETPQPPELRENRLVLFQPSSLVSCGSSYRLRAVGKWPLLEFEGLIFGRFRSNSYWKKSMQCNPSGFIHLPFRFLFITLKRDHFFFQCVLLLTNNNWHKAFHLFEHQQIIFQLNLSKRN